MTGFEYQVAGHMLWEGMVMEGLAIARAIHDRYHPARRNPWNEVECGDHYARAMASYGVFLAACGYEYHGPRGHLGFAPRLSPGNFRAAFTSAEGWGQIGQTRSQGKQIDTVEVKWGKLRLRTLSLVVAENHAPQSVHVTVGGVECGVQAFAFGRKGNGRAAFGPFTEGGREARCDHFACLNLKSGQPSRASLKFSAARPGPSAVGFSGLPL